MGLSSVRVVSEIMADAHDDCCAICKIKLTKGMEYRLIYAPSPPDLFFCNDCVKVLAKELNEKQTNQLQRLHKIYLEINEMINPS